MTSKETYRYDGHGRRVLAWSSTGGNILSQYSQSGQLVFQQDQRQGKNIDHIYLAGSLVATREHNYGTGVTAVRYQHTDALGSPVAVTNEAGQVLERTQFEPFGAAIGKTIQGVGYTGHVMDAVTGLTYMQQRYYDPSIGRFLSVDPVTANSGTGANFNRYWYANNNPYRFTDPDGRLGASCLGRLCDEYRGQHSRSCEATCVGKSKEASESPGRRSYFPFTPGNFKARQRYTQMVVDRVRPIMVSRTFRSENDAAKYFRKVLQPAATKYGMEIEAVFDKRLSGAYFLDGFAVSQVPRKDGYGADVNAPTTGLPTIHAHPIVGGYQGQHYPFSPNDVGWASGTWGADSGPDFHFVSDPSGVYRLEMGSDPTVTPLGE